MKNDKKFVTCYHNIIMRHFFCDNQAKKNSISLSVTIGDGVESIFQNILDNIVKGKSYAIVMLSLLIIGSFTLILSIFIQVTYSNMREGILSNRFTCFYLIIL